MNKKGFLLVDSLITVVIVTVSCYLCMDIYKLVNEHITIYDEYKNYMTIKYNSIFNELGECEKCIILEEDSSLLEP